MKKGYLGIGIASVLLILPLLMQGQGGPNVITPEKTTKIVRGCLYEVIPGLAEITKLEIDKTADESLLHYNEHEVLFKFTPMGSAELLPCLKEQELEFTLRSNVTKIPVGPQYVQQKRIKVGTKYAMNILQIKNKDACLEQYTYESKALDNDLFEAEAQIIPFVKGSYSESIARNSATEKLKNCFLEEVVEEELPIDDLGVNVDSLKASIRIALEAKRSVKRVSKNLKSVSKSYISNTTAIKKARKVAKEKNRQEKLVKKQALAAKKERAEKLKALKAKLEREIELEIQAEINGKQEAE
jgi:hypothetical protein